MTMINDEQFRRVLEQALAYQKKWTSDIILDKSFVTRQVAISGTPTKILDVARPQVFRLAVTGATDVVLIGDKNVTTASGHPITINDPLIIAVRENVQIWAVSSGTPTLFILEMGI